MMLLFAFHEPDQLLPVYAGAVRHGDQVMYKASFTEHVKVITAYAAAITQMHLPRAMHIGRQANV